MIAKPRPSPDDTPSPELVTPARLARELVAIATAASRLRIRARGLALYLAPTPGPYPTALDRLTALAEQLAFAGDRAVDLATAVRVGAVTLDERYLDPSCRPERPLLDYAERRELEQAADAIAPRIAARGADDGAWTDERPPALVALPSASAADVDQLVGQARNQARSAHGIGARGLGVGENGSGNCNPPQPPTPNPQPRSKRSAAAVKANETRKREAQAPKPNWLIEAHGDALEGERVWLIYDRPKSQQLATISAPDLAVAEARARILFRRRKASDLEVVAYEEVFGPFPVDLEVQRCRVCGCTDEDCRQCIEKTGEPCSWVEEDLCSACVTADWPAPPPPEHPAAGPARKAARRRKAATANGRKGGAP